METQSKSRLEHLKRRNKIRGHTSEDHDDDSTVTKVSHKTGDDNGGNNDNIDVPPSSSKPPAVDHQYTSWKSGNSKCKVDPENGILDRSFQSRYLCSRSCGHSFMVISARQMNPMIK
jgi:hypothetical protein